jgi:hypothetical protein
MKSLIAVVAGIVVGVVVLSLAEQIGQALLQMLMGIEPITAQGAAALGTSRPTESLAAVVAACFLGPLAGGYVAGRLAPSKPLVHAAAVGAFQMILGVIGLVLFPSPLWFAFATVSAFALGPLVGASLSRV